MTSKISSTLMNTKLLKLATKGFPKPSRKVSGADQMVKSMVSNMALITLKSSSRSCNRTRK